MCRERSQGRKDKGHTHRKSRQEDQEAGRPPCDSEKHMEIQWISNSMAVAKTVVGTQSGLFLYFKSKSSVATLENAATLWSSRDCVDQVPHLSFHLHASQVNSDFIFKSEFASIATCAIFYWYDCNILSDASGCSFTWTWMERHSFKMLVDRWCIALSKELEWLSKVAKGPERVHVRHYARLHVIFSKVNG